MLLQGWQNPLIPPRLTVSVKAREVLDTAFTPSLCVSLANSLLPKLKGVALSFSEQSGE